MIDTTEAEEAWWPPTFTPEDAARHLVGVMDHARSQPEHPLLDPVEDLQVRGARGDEGTLGLGPFHASESRSLGVDHFPNSIRTGSAYWT